MRIQEGVVWTAQEREPNAPSRLRLGRFLIGFCTAKIAIYLIPLGLAATAPPNVYGAIEFTYAVALLVVTLAIAAPLLGMSHRYLMREDPDIEHQKHALAAAALIAALVGLAAAVLLHLPPMILISLPVCGLTAFQVIESFTLRAKRRPLIVAWIDGLVPISGLTIVLCCEAWFGVSLDATTACFAALDAMIVARLLVLGRTRGVGVSEVWARLRISTRAGATMAAYAVFSTWIAVSGRILIGFATPLDLPAFAVAFRVAGIAYGVPQMAITAMWSRLYTAREATCDALLAAFLVGGAMATAVTAEGGRVFLSRVALDALPPAAAATAGSMLPALSLYVFFWGAHSLLQPLVNRFGAAGPAIGPMAALSAAGPILMVWARHRNVTAATLGWLLALYAGLYFWTVWLVLRRKSVRLPRTGIAAALGGAALLLLDFIP